MLDLIDYEAIRRLHRAGFSIREIARRVGHCRKTIRKVLKWDGSPPRYTLKEPRPCPTVTNEIRNFVVDVLARDEIVTPKQRHTAKRIYERLVAEFAYEGSESGIRRLVGKLRREQSQVSRVTTPLSFEPGEETQVDWGYAQVTIAGALT